MCTSPSRSNQGTIEHDLVLEEGEREVARAVAGSSARGTVTLEAGTFIFYCSILGHHEAGMEGTLIAE